MIQYVLLTGLLNDVGLVGNIPLINPWEKDICG